MVENEYWQMQQENKHATMAFGLVFGSFREDGGWLSIVVIVAGMRF